MALVLIYLPLVSIFECSAEIFFSESHICRNNSVCENEIPCQILDNVTCILDPEENCRPRYISTFDDSETICSKNDRLYCTDEEITMHCPMEQSIKVWKASIIEMNPEFCVGRGTGFNKQGKSYCTYATLSDEVLSQIYQKCESLQSCSFFFQKILNSACDGIAFSSSGNALVLRLDYQCVPALTKEKNIRLLIPLLWIVLSVAFALITFGTVVCVDWSNWCEQTQREPNRTHWQSSVPLLLAPSEVDFV